jgi:hypothetical protein
MLDRWVSADALQPAQERKVSARRRTALAAELAADLERLLERGPTATDEPQVMLIAVQVTLGQALLQEGSPLAAWVTIRSHSRLDPAQDHIDQPGPVGQA